MEEKYLFEETSRILENIPQQNRSRRLISWLVFVLSCALFIILGSIFWDAVFALIIFITILAHEIGHFAAFKICGCRNVSVMMLPFVGGVTMARDAKISSANRVFCALSGPILGLLSAFASLIFFFFGDGCKRGRSHNLCLLRANCQFHKSFKFVSGNAFGRGELWRGNSLRATKRCLRYRARHLSY